MLHLDVMDGHFVPNLTMGPDLCAALRRAFPSAFLDVHLMVTHPQNCVAPFRDAGADHLTWHVEAKSLGNFCPLELAASVRDKGMTAGLAINPPTDVSALDPYLEVYDMILVMSVNPGYAGQSFIESVLDKTRALAPRLRDDQRLEMDGGIDPVNAARCIEAGCDILAAASSIFKRPDYRAAIAALRNAGSPAPR